MKKIWQPQLAPFRAHKKKILDQQKQVVSFIYQIGESEQLRKPSKEVSLYLLNSQETQRKIAYLKRCMRRYRKLTGVGRGIAGVQIGIPEQIFVVCLPEQENKLLIVINPKITKESKTHIRYSEICMSAHPIIAPVVRPVWIECSYYDEFGKKQYWKTKAKDKRGMIYNRLFQHEIDHLHGIINIDRVSSKDLVLESDPKFYDKATFKKLKKTK